MTSATWNRNRLTAKLGIEYPIIQGPLGGLASQRLTAAVSNLGGPGQCRVGRTVGRESHGGSGHRIEQRE